MIARSLFKLTANVLGLAEVVDFERQNFKLPQKLNRTQMFKYVLLPPFWQTLVSGSTFLITGFVITKILKKWIYQLTNFPK